MGIDAQAMVLLSLLAGGDSADLSLIKAVAMKWYNGLRVQGSTAYIEAPGQPHAAGLGANALALRVFVSIPAAGMAKDPLVEKLANYGD
jgi:hypothetical protein